MKEIIRWSTNHQLAFTIILFILGCIVSVYSGNIKRFLSIPPQKLGTWILKSRLLTAEAQLRRLDASKKDILVVFSVAMRTILFTLLVIMSLIGLGVTHLSEQIYYTFRGSGSPSAQPILILIASVAASRIFLVMKFLLRLEDFDYARSVLTSKIENLTSQLNAKSLSGKASA